VIIRLLFILRRRWPIVLVLPLAGAALGVLLTPTGQAVVSTSYAATATVAVNQQSLSQASIKQALIESRQGAVADGAAKLIGGTATASDVSRTISSSFDETAYVITFKSTSARKDIAASYVKAFSDAFVAVNNGSVTQDAGQKLVEATQARDQARQAVDDFIAANREQLDGTNGQSPSATLQLQLQDLRTQQQAAETALANLQNQPVEADQYRVIAVSDPALVSDNKLELPASRLLRGTLGLMLGIIGAAVVIAIVEKLNPRIDDPQQASDIIGAPVLAMVPVMGRRRSAELERASLDAFRGPFAEAFRSMRSHLNFRMQAEGMETPPRIMVTSATPSEGKSTSAAFLAVSYAEAQNPPVVIGADLRRPSIHNLFDIERVPGLSSRATVGGTSIPLAEIVKTDPVTGVSVVPSGPAVDRITGLLSDLTVITRAARDAGRVVIVDTPPVMVANDATDFLSATDWVVVVVRVGRSTERAVKQMMTTLNLNEAKVVGVIMVGSVESTDAKRYYYSYYAVEADDERSRPVVSLQDEEISVDALRTTGLIEAPAIDDAADRGSDAAGS
jgi:capsular exopolysaccharide synthesis family protein